MNHLEPIGEGGLLYKEKTIILSIPRTLDPIVAKLGTQLGLVYVIIKFMNDLFESNRSSMTFFQFFVLPIEVITLIRLSSNLTSN